MKKLFKKSLAVILTALLLISTVPITVSAAEATADSVGATSGTTGDCTWTLDDNGVLTISGTGEIGNHAFSELSALDITVNQVVINYGVTEIGKYAFASLDFSSVSIPNSVKTIGENAFLYCSNLSNVTIPGSVKSIEEYAFFRSPNITNVTISDGVLEIGDWSFAYCSSLSNISIPDSVDFIGNDAFYNTSWYSQKPNGLVYAGKLLYKYKGKMPANTSVEIEYGTKGIVYSAFDGCSGLTNISIPNTVTSIGERAFFNCSELENISIPSSVTSIGRNAFYLTRWYNNQPDGMIYIGDIAYQYKGEMPDNTSLIIEDGTKSITGYAFYNCLGLTSITIPGSVTGIGNYAFCNCYSLANVTLSEGISYIGESAFYSCRELSSLILPDSLTSIGCAAFARCSKLTSVNIPANVDRIDKEVFRECSLLTNLTVSENNPVYDSRNNCNAIIDTNKNKLIVTCKTTTIPYGIVSIGDSAFYDCYDLTSISIPNSVKNIGEMAFSSCNKLKNLILPDSVTNIENDAFEHCDALTSLTIPNSVTKIESHAFGGCRKLTTINLPNSLKFIASFLFLGCSELTTVNIPDNVKTIEVDSFSLCPKLTNITIPNGVTNIETFAFRGCGFTEVTIPRTVKEIGENAFGYEYYGNNVKIENFVIKGGIGSEAQRYAEANDIPFVAIKNIIASGITGDCTWELDDEGTLTISGNGAMGDYDYNKPAPWKNYEFSKVIIEDGVTNVGNVAFYCCVNLSDISLPDGLTKVGYGAFESCTSLSSIDLPDSVTNLQGCAFENCTSLSSITIPNGVTSFGSGTFYGCTSLSRIFISDNVNRISFSNQAWHQEPYIYCLEEYINPFPNLSEIIISEGNTKYDSRNNCNAIIETESNTLVYGCKNTVIPNSVTSIGEEAFEECIGLENITIPESVSNINACAFLYCKNLSSITIPRSVTSIGINTFEGCKNLTIYGYEDSYAETYANSNNIPFVAIKNIIASGTTGDCTWELDDKGRLTISGNGAMGNYTYGDSAPWNDYQINKVTIENGVKTMCNYAFHNCTCSTEINIPNSVTSIGRSAFESTEFPSITIPNSVTSIGDSAFEDCRELTSITIPNSVTSFGSSLFFWCKKLNNDSLVLIEYAYQDSDPNNIDTNNVLLNEKYHAVLGYGIESGSYEYNDKTYKHRILIADPNYLTYKNEDEKFDNACIYYNDDGSWICPYWNKNRNNTKCYWNAGSTTNRNSENYTGRIKNIMKIYSLTDVVDLVYTSTDYVAGITIFNKSKNKTTIEKVPGTGDQNPENSEIIPYSLCDENENDAELYALPDATADYSVSFDNKPTNYSMMMDYENVSYFAKVENGTSTLVKPEGYINIEGSNATYSITMMTDNSKDKSDWYSITVSGNNANNVTLTKREDGYLIKTDSSEDSLGYILL